MTSDKTTVEAALLDQYSKSIDAMLQIRNLPRALRTILEQQKFFVTFLKAIQEDRYKVSVMWRGYQNLNRLLWILIPLVAGDIFLRLWSLLYP